MNAAAVLQPYYGNDCPFKDKLYRIYSDGSHYIARAATHAKAPKRIQRDKTEQKRRFSTSGIAWKPPFLFRFGLFGRSALRAPLSAARQRGARIDKGARNALFHVKRQNLWQTKALKTPYNRGL